MKDGLFVRIAHNGFAWVLLVAVIVSGYVLIIFNNNISGLVAAVTSAINGAPAVIYFMPYDDSTQLAVGDTKTIDLNINASVPVNAVGATIDFPQDSLEVVDISKQRSFLDLWTQDTTLQEQHGALQFSGGTTQPGGMSGTSTVITITVRAEKSGTATLSLSGVQVFAADGKGTALDTDDRSLTLDIASATPPVAVTSGSGGGAPATPQVPQPTPPSADLNGDGAVNLVDISILVVHMIMPYNPRFDLNLDGKVDLSDLSVLFAKMGTH